MGISTSAILQQGELTLKGEFIWGSNYTFLVEVKYAKDTYLGVYKPTRGERPLWDFPESSLAQREVAAYLVSEALGWDLVPPTTYRQDGHLGPGSLQLFIEHDPEYHYFKFNPEDRQLLRPVVLFDLLINNADRKGSHILFDANHHLWLIDHGICFHVEDKLRTVVWDFGGEPFPNELTVSLDAFSLKLKNGSSAVLDSLRELLSAGEIRALTGRASRLLASGCFPNPHPNKRAFPWPPV